MTGIVGIIINPRAGKDLRRLVGGSPAANDASVSDLSRMIIGARENGAERIVVPVPAVGPVGETGASTGFTEPGHPGLPSAGAIERAVAGFDNVELLAVESPRVSETSAYAAAALREAGVDVVLVTGGDGTHRDVARGWPDAPIVARAAGTNNAFGQPIEATMAGAAAGLVASSMHMLDELVAYRALTIDIDIEGVPTDLALVSVAILRDDPLGSGSIWQVDRIDQVFAAVAEPWSVGLSALAAVVAPTSRSEDGGVLLELSGDESRRIRAATAPGWFVDAGLRSVSTVELEQPVAVRGPGVFIVDGERGPALNRDEWGSMTMRRNGPRVIDVRRTFSIAVRQSRFYFDLTRHDAPTPAADRADQVAEAATEVAADGVARVAEAAADGATRVATADPDQRAPGETLTGEPEPVEFQNHASTVEPTQEPGQS